jgi:adenosylhomocysteine nucleosidase
MELKGLAKRLEGVRSHPDLEGVRTGSLAGLTIYLVRTGVGRGAGRAAEAVFAAFRPDASVCIGTAGGLMPALKIGDVVACTEVFGAEGGSHVADPRLLDAAVLAGARKGACLTVKKALVGPGEKAGAHEETGAALCEMEAAFVAEAASTASVPFLALKTVSDTVKDRLPDVSRFMDDRGNLDRKGMAGYLALHPDEAARSARFLRNAGRAVEVLTAVLLETVERLARNA